MRSGEFRRKKPGTKDKISRSSCSRRKSRTSSGKGFAALEADKNVTVIESSHVSYQRYSLEQISFVFQERILNARTGFRGASRLIGSLRRASNRGLVFMSLPEYLQLLNWIGRQLKPGKRGSVGKTATAILERLDLSAELWLLAVEQFGKRRSANRVTPVSRFNTAATSLISGSEQRWPTRWALLPVATMMAAHDFQRIRHHFKTIRKCPMTFELLWSRCGP